MADVLRGIELNEERFLTLLEKLIGVSDKLQNAPPALVPQEGLVADFIWEVISPHLTENGGPLEAWRVEYTPGRPNVCMRYKGKTDKVVSFVGSHLDVVPADPALWERDPFKLIREGDKLWGRGTTDCLGHIALITTLMSQIAELKPELDTTINVIFIASEEFYTPSIGVDEMMKRGDAQHVMGGPVLWVDASNSQPCVGTAGTVTWTLTATGKLFHSGFPNKTVNAIELGIDAVHEIQRRFYEDFPPHPKEQEYAFVAPSSLKPTRVDGMDNSLNQIPGTFRISGDVRLSPFYNMAEMVKKVEGYVEDINKNLSNMANRGPSKYVVEGIESSVSIQFGGIQKGVYADMDSPGYAALAAAIQEVRGKLEPFAVCGSLPLVGDLKEAGMDLQMIGFGLMHTYHANNEHALLSDLKDGAKALARFVANLEDKSY